MIWRCRFELSTTSSSMIPSVPTPAAARYNSAGDPSPPAPTTSTRACLQPPPAPARRFRAKGCAGHSGSPRPHQKAPLAPPPQVAPTARADAQARHTVQEHRPGPIPPITSHSAAVPPTASRNLLIHRADPTRCTQPLPRRPDRNRPQCDRQADARTRLAKSPTDAPRSPPSAQKPWPIARPVWPEPARAARRLVQNVKHREPRLHHGRNHRLRNPVAVRTV